jgi:hypothetical protein
VTEAIHAAHEEAAARRAKPVTKRKRVIKIAAVADERAERTPAPQGKKKSPGKSRRK